MKTFITLSFGTHAALLALLVAMSTLLGKPRLSYYAVDLYSAPPAGASAPSAPDPAPAAPPAPAPPKPVVQEAPVPKDAIKIPSKEKPKKAVPPPAKAKPAPPKPKHSAAFDAAMRALEKEGPAGARNSRPSAAGITGASGAGVVGEAGPAFPYPWYLKAIADKLDKQWHPPEEFQSDTLCEVGFTIVRDGQVSGATVEKPSGDSVFDQLALRAVLYANPLPPLPSGYPEETLKVHMKFVGKH
jgi:protein TonB